MPARSAAPAPWGARRQIPVVPHLPSRLQKVCRTVTVCRNFSRLSFLFFLLLKNIPFRVPSDSFTEAILWCTPAFTVDFIANDDGCLRRRLENAVISLLEEGNAFFPPSCSALWTLGNMLMTPKVNSFLKKQCSVGLGNLVYLSRWPRLVLEFFAKTKYGMHIEEIESQTVRMPAPTLKHGVSFLSCWLDSLVCSLH